MTGPDAAARSAVPASIATVAAARVGDLTELSAAALPEPFTGLGAPPGWHRAELTGSAPAPARMLVCGQHPDGSRDGCDTIRAFTFTAHLAPDLVRANAACTLQSLGAEHLTAGALAAPSQATAVRSSGYFTAGRRFWAQFSTYVTHATPSACGLLIEHTLVVDSGCHAALSDDITALSNSVHHAFLTTAADSSDTPGFRRFRYDATGLRGKRMRITDDLPTSDAGHLQHVLLGLTDVICLDDTPGVMHDLRVHPIGQPDTVALVECSQLALYDSQ